MEPSKPIICLDFDGVIHSYASGWQGGTVIPDPPVPGAIAFLREAVQHFRVAIHSSRSHMPGGREAMIRALDRWAEAETGSNDWTDVIDWPAYKPPAFVTIDDRALTFVGTFPSMDMLKKFKPWNGQPR